MFHKKQPLKDQKWKGKGSPNSAKKTSHKKTEPYSPEVSKNFWGVFHADQDSGQGSDEGGYIISTERKTVRKIKVRAKDRNNASHHCLVEARFVPRHEVEGAQDDRTVYATVCNVHMVVESKNLFDIAILEHGLPKDFSKDVLKEARDAKPDETVARTDLRSLPFLTIDPVDAKDFDDAIYAEQDTSSTNVGGWVIWVAIADVTAYVAPDTGVDIEARKRGNSVYFSSQVIPMLPESLSNEACSLKPLQDRLCVVVRMVIDSHGNRLEYEMMRGEINSRARLSYEQAQAFLDDKNSKSPASQGVQDLSDEVKKSLGFVWEAFACLQKARYRRQPLQLSLREYRIVHDKAGKVCDVCRVVPLEAHSLIEEYMVSANACAADFLQKKGLVGLYRVHEPPQADRVLAFRDVLKSLSLKMASKRRFSTADFNSLLLNFHDHKDAFLVNEIVLRTQAQAHYSHENSGHFGLNLNNYSHFTSPIRRYADLIVHRAICALLKEDAKQKTSENTSEKSSEKTSTGIEAMKELAAHLSQVERRGVQAERDTKARLVSSFMEKHKGEAFTGMVSGIHNRGVFVQIVENGAEGFLPLHALHDDHYTFSEHHQSLKGRRTGKVLRVGITLPLRLETTLPVSGVIRFALEGKSFSHKPRSTKNFSNKSQNGKRPFKRDDGDSTYQGRKRPFKRDEDGASDRPPRKRSFSSKPQDGKRPFKRDDGDSTYQGRKRPFKRDEDGASDRPPRKRGFSSKPQDGKRPFKRDDGDSTYQGRKRPFKRDEDGASDRPPRKRSFSNKPQDGKRPFKRDDGDSTYQGRKRPFKRDEDGASDRPPRKRSFSSKPQDGKRPFKRDDGDSTYQGRKRPFKRDEDGASDRPPRKRSFSSKPQDGKDRSNVMMATVHTKGANDLQTG